MKKHTYKMIAPIIITILMVLYYAGIIFSAVYFDMPLPATLVAIVIPTLLGGVMIYVCIQRIREIRSGEEDDLSKY